MMYCMYCAQTRCYCTVQYDVRTVVHPRSSSFERHVQHTTTVDTVFLLAWLVGWLLTMDDLWDWSWLACKLFAVVYTLLLIVGFCVAAGATPRHRNQSIEDWMSDVYDTFCLSCKAGARTEKRQS
jgi:hypothetical protein